MPYVNTHFCGYLIIFVLIQNVVVSYLKAFFLLNPFALMLTNVSLWVPQIVKNYRNRSRRGPGLQVALSMFMTQTTLPLYLKIREGNFLEVRSNLSVAFLMLGFIFVQLFLLKTQQVLGPRWFVPKRFRCRNANIHNYYTPVPAELLDKGRAFLRKPEAEQEEEAEEDMVCTICLQPVYIKVDLDGNVSDQQQQDTSLRGRTQHLLANLRARFIRQPANEDAGANILPDTDTHASVQNADGVEMATINEDDKVEENDIEMNLPKPPLTDEEVEARLNKEYMKTP